MSEKNEYTRQLDADTRQRARQFFLEEHTATVLAGLLSGGYTESEELAIERTGRLFDLLHPAPEPAQQDGAEAKEK